MLSRIIALCSRFFDTLVWHWTLWQKKFARMDADALLGLANFVHCQSCQELAICHHMVTKNNNRKGRKGDHTF